MKMRVKVKENRNSSQHSPQNLQLTSRRERDVDGRLRLPAKATSFRSRAGPLPDVEVSRQDEVDAVGLFVSVEEVSAERYFAGPFEDDARFRRVFSSFLFPQLPFHQLLLSFYLFSKRIGSSDCVRLYAVENSPRTEASE